MRVDLRRHLRVFMGGTVAKLAFVPPPAQYFDDGSLVWLKTIQNHKVPACFIPYPRTTRTLLFSHGNAEDLGLLWDHLKTMRDRLKVSVFSYEYPGYGLSEGVPSEEGVYGAIDAAYDYLVKNCNVDPSQDLIVYGRSLGSGPTVDIASRRPVRAVILQSPLTSCVRVVINVRVSFDMFRNIDKIAKIRSPVLIMHGTEDEVVPFQHGVTLHRACKAPSTTVWIQGAGHNDIEFKWRDLYFETLEKFLHTLDDKYPPSQRSAGPKSPS
mmetsp:Transcript_23348/g.38405  ORF Transcript_23348/g.38405 Transcript_23348/m.38405 type:complete len:268 (+) Transcript_23348:97-900(+)